MASGIATFLGKSVENALQTFVTTTSISVSAGIAPVVSIGLTIWAITYGLAVMRNEVPEPVTVFLKNLTKIAIIMSLALGAGIYQSQVADGVYAFQDWFVAIVSPSNAGKDIYEVIDNFDANISELSFVILGRGLNALPWGGWLDLATGIITLLASSVMIIVILGFVIVAKAALAFMLGIGPAFLACLAFPPFAKFFEAWTAKVMNYVFLIVGMAVMTTMATVIVDTYASHFLKNQNASNAIADAFGLVIVEATLAVLILQMPNIAAGLGGGASLSGGGLAGFALGLIAGKGGEKKDKEKEESGGGSVENDGDNKKGNKGGGNSGGNGQNGGGDRTPAFRRPTLDRLQQRNS